MRTQIDRRPDRTPIVRRAAAGLILVVAAAIAIKLVIGFVMAFLWIIVAVAVVAAVIWAMNNIR